MPFPNRALRIALVIAAVPLAGVLGAAWWSAAHWGPDRTEWPVQGALIDARHDAGVVLALAEGEQAGQGGAIPVDFVYAQASIGANDRNPRFAAQHDRATRSGIAFGAIHLFDPCATADRQAANFVTIVPRDPAMLPPVAALSGSGEDCEPSVRPAEVESELVTFLNEIEMHAGKRAILFPTAAFEDEYGFAARSQRGLWLADAGGEPDEAGRPWRLWTASEARRIAGIDEPVGWIVARR